MWKLVQNPQKMLAYFLAVPKYRKGWDREKAKNRIVISIPKIEPIVVADAQIAAIETVLEIFSRFRVLAAPYVILI